MNKLFLKQELNKYYKIFSVIVPYLPLLTSLLFVYPVMILCVNKKNVNIYLSFILLFMSFFSFLFWLNPIKNRYTIKHFIDKCFARFAIITFILYNLFINKKNINLFLISVSIMFLFFYLSNCYSKKKWCSNIHIFFHLLAHIFAIVCSYLTLI